MNSTPDSLIIATAMRGLSDASRRAAAWLKQAPIRIEEAKQ